MKKNIVLSLLFWLLFLNAKGQIKVLIVDGFSNHDWKQTTKMVKQILDETGKFSISVSTVPPKTEAENWVNWLPNFTNYDVIIQNTNNINDTTMRWNRTAEVALEKYVKSGGGLYILHSGNNAFIHWQEYNEMIGLGWRPNDFGVALQVNSLGKIIRIPAGEGRGTYHGNRSNLVFHKLNTHPINKDFPSEWMVADVELYQFARGPAKNITVLSYGNDAKTNINWPVEWVIKYGKGRVYNSTMGHLWKGDIYPIGYRCIAFQTTLIRAVEWCATKKVKYPIPANFPTKDAVSLRRE